MGQIALRKKLLTSSQLSTYVLNNGDIAVNETTSTIVVGDGSTPGGVALLNTNFVFPIANGSQNGYMSSAAYTTLQTLAAIGNATAFTAGYMSAADYNTLQALAAAGGSSLPNSSGNVANTLVLRDASGNFAANIITAVSFAGNLTGNAATATNGVVTTGSYSNPPWITSINAAILSGTIPSGVSFAGTIPWTSVSGKPTVVSYFTNDAGYINGSGNTTGTSGGVQSSGGRETSSPSANTVILRSSTGTAQVATPVSSSDIATKAYVDANSGGFGYALQPPINMPSNPFAGGGIVSAFSQNIYNESATGYIKSIIVDVTGLGNFGFSPSVLQNTFFGFSSDGLSEQVISIYNFVIGFGLGPANAMGGNITQQYKCILDLSYKISMALRVFTTSSQSVPGTQFSVQVFRYLRSS